MDQQTSSQIHPHIQRRRQAAQPAQRGHRLLPEIPLVLALQPGQAHNRVRFIPPEAQGAALLDDHSSQEEAKEGQAPSRGHVRCLQRDWRAQTRSRQYEVFDQAVQRGQNGCG